MTYLDNAATTLMKPPEVEAAMLEALHTCANAGRGGHSAAMAASDVLFDCREAAAELFGVDNPEQVIFTMNATHALNLAIKGILHGGGHCVISGYEHNSVARPLAAMEQDGVSFTVAHSKLFEPEDALKSFRQSLRADSKCVVCTHVSNAFGYILPIEEIDAMCYEKGIALIIDASQSAGTLPVKLNKLKATLAVCAPGHKGLYGPQGTGLLLLREDGAFPTLMEGGTGSLSADLHQPDFLPDRLESGTQNIHGIAGLCQGIRYIQRVGQDVIFQYERGLCELAIQALREFRGVTVYAAKNPEHQAGVVSFIADAKSPDDLAYELGSMDVAVRGGLHCSPISHESVGTRRGAVRVSVSWFNTEEDIVQLERALEKVLRD